MTKNQFDSGAEALLTALMGENAAQIMFSGNVSICNSGNLTPSDCPSIADAAQKALDNMGRG